MGSFIQDSTGAYFGKDLNTFMADLMFKYQGLSVMAEYADKSTGDNNPFVLDGSGNKIGTFYTGSGLSVQAGFMFKSNWELFLDIQTSHLNQELQMQKHNTRLG